MGQEVQEVCPVAAVQTFERSAGKAATTVAVPVLEPAGQLLHATVGSVLFVAVGQAVHVVAPVAASVLVMDPAAQTVQLSAVHAAGEPVQMGVGVEGVPPTEGVRRYFPAAQAAQEDAPALEPVLVMDPAVQGVQAVLPTVGEGEAATYVPGGHEEQAVAPGVGQDTGGEYCPAALQ